MSTTPLTEHMESYCRDNEETLDPFCLMTEHARKLEEAHNNLITEYRKLATERSNDGRDTAKKLSGLTLRLDISNHTLAKTRSAGRAVVDARYNTEGAAWERLKIAIGELEGIVGRTP